MRQVETVKTIDARGLEPPEPFELTMAALETCAASQSVLLLLSREPYPLYRALELNGYCRETRHRLDGTVEILIWREFS
ncbi:MAG: SirA-like protein [Comamonadaceae bacterium CG12_big_fil_rev_8_21_14_0_65_59_15]|nr:MAG: SirA-like protein [Comamonadaceae bacterium CG12_big_fil_rev_8_21_14_0_65_59_15]